jgi:surface antigen
LRLASPTTALPRQVINKQTGLRKKTSAPSASKIAAYAGAFLLLIAVVAISYQSPRQVNNHAAVATSQLQSPSASNKDSPSVDQVVATDIAADLASRANLPIATNVANMSISLAAKSDLAQTDSSAITKPQIIQPDSNRTDVITYTTVQGDTIPSLAAKFGVSSDTIRNSNNLGNTDVVAAGRVLSILPMNGLLYTAAAGDTVDTVASKFSASSQRIKLVNNLELTGVTAGKQLIIPDGVKPAPVAAVVAPRIAGDSAGGTRLNSNVFASAGNRYAPGNCTWYVYERRQQVGQPVGSYWGNANTWASSARAAGLLVNRSPAAGAVLVDQAGYFGHVAFVERVLPNGDVYITEMNNYAYGGFNQVNDRTISAGQASSYLYIH